MNVQSVDVLTTINRASIIIASKIREEMMICIRLSYVNLQRQKSVQNTSDADVPTIESNVFTTKTNTKQSFATFSRIK